MLVISRDKANSLDVMSEHVDAGEEQHGIRQLPMEPLRLVEWQESCFWSDPSQDVSTHGQEKKCGVKREDEAGAARQPNGEGEGVQPSELFIRLLQVPEETVSTCSSIHLLDLKDLPSQHKKPPMQTPKYYIERQFPARELVPEKCFDPAASHDVCVEGVWKIGGDAWIGRAKDHVLN